MLSSGIAERLKGIEDDMTVRRLAAPEVQPKEFEFTAENLTWARKEMTKYPVGRQASAVIPLLRLAQEQGGGWLTRAAMDYVADFLARPLVRVYEVATFYTMFQLHPVGRHHLQICTTTPCWLRDSDAIVAACQKRLGIGFGEVTPDGQFSLEEVECLGACVNAPMLSIRDEYYEDLTPETTVALIDALARGEQPRPGPQIDRITSAPATGLTTLTTPPPSALGPAGKDD